MKTIFCLLIITVCLFMDSPSRAATQARPGYFDNPVKVIAVGEIKESEKYPLIIFMPFTTGSAERYFSIISPFVGLENYFAIIPDGDVQAGDYLPDFFSYIKWFEQRLLSDLPEILKSRPVDPARIYMTGFSVGGDLSWAFIIRQKELLAGTLILGSRCSYVPNSSQMKYLKEKKSRIVMLTGESDLPERIKGMDNAVRLAEKNRLTHWHWKFNGDHWIPSEKDLRKASNLMLNKNE